MVMSNRDVPESAADHVSKVRDFLQRGKLAGRLKAAEEDLRLADGEDCERVANRHGLTMSLLRSAVAARHTVDGAEDLIHAIAVAQSLSLILDAGENAYVAPRLARKRDWRYQIENDSRLVLVHTAESHWPDATRWLQSQRELFREYMRLAIQCGDRDAALVLLSNSNESLRFFSTNTDRVAWALEGAPKAYSSIFRRRGLGDPNKWTIREFVEASSHVQFVDLNVLAPNESRQ